ncbi:MAG TPA: ATP-binding protein, partial [Polyangiales bacterium]|nr:ATP-binding protein [Polyangiales bacterium]
MHSADLVEQLRALGTVGHNGDWTVDAPAGPGMLVRIRLMPDTPLRGVRAFIIVQTIAKLGEVLVTEPHIEDLQSEGFGSDFALRLATTTEPSVVEELIRRAGDVAEVELNGDLAKETPVEKPVVRVPTRTSGAFGEETGSESDGSRNARARTVRIDVRRLDALMNLAGELVIARGRLTKLSTDLGNAALEETVTQASALITELRDEITASRMVPVSHVFDRFPRIVRDAARGVGKQVEFVVEGKDIELDRSMLDELGDSIVHLLRNAIDHGIEDSEKRAAAGKPEVGRLVLSAARDRSAIVIKVSDDGKGIDRSRVLARAKRDGLIDQSRTDLTEDELLRLIARPGFSTAETVTSMSGRGVGVDAVYTRVRSLGGAMDIRSVQGQGTTMILRLPLTLAVVRAVLARVGDETYAIPLAHVSESVELLPADVRTVNGREVLLSSSTARPAQRESVRSRP